MIDTTVESKNPVHQLLEGSALRDAYRLSFLANHLTGPVYAGIERDCGLTRPEYLTLLCLHHRDGLAAKDISLLAGYPKNSISRAVHLLRDKGLINRRPHPTDGRRATLHITATGADLCATTIDRFLSQQSRLLQILSAAERRQLDALLTKLIEASPDWIDPY